MYNDARYLNKRNIFYQKYFADVLYSRSSPPKNKVADDFFGSVAYKIDISRLSSQDCYRMASYQRSLFFRQCVSKLKNTIKAGIYNFTLRSRKRNKMASADIDA